MLTQRLLMMNSQPIKTKSREPTLLTTRHILIDDTIFLLITESTISKVKTPTQAEPVP